ncbi:MAG: SPFH domain-containing protein [Patescibacteria group bacterium]
MNAHDLPGIGTARTIPIGIAKALSVGVFPASIAHFILRNQPPNIDYAASLVVCGAATVAALSAFMRHDAEVEVGEYGVHQVFGTITGKVFGPGNHPLYPDPVESLIKVSSREKPLDPPAFEELAQDTVPVFADGYFIVQIVDPILHVTSVAESDAHEALMGEFDSEIRLFVNQWNRATDLKSSKELLVRFLKLNGGVTSDEAARRLKEDLLKLTPLHGKDFLTVEAVNNIMEDAGKFCATAAKWGYRVTQVHFQKLDLPDYIKAAAARAAAAKFEMDEAQVKQERRTAMIKQLKVELPGLTDNEARQAVDLLLKLSTETVTEIKIRDLEKVSANLAGGGAMAARTVERIARRFGVGQQKGKV